MPRRERLSISLFPFMSILACTIGALTFLLVTMAMTSVGANRLVADVEEQRTADFEERRPALEAELARLEREWADLNAAEVLLEELDAELDLRGLDSDRSLAGILADLAKADRASRLDAEIERIDRELGALAAERGTIETSIEVLESRRETLPILIDPTGLSRNQTPFFIECDVGGATALRARDDFEYFVPYDEISTNGDFGRYLRRARALPGALLILLVREDGIRTARRVDAMARSASIRVAQLPLPGGGPLDFRLVRRAEGGS
jgi:multidrug efflux pump subunit AcrA (membrane-fusion protein)